jgi:uroporphyrinogen-III synthase
MHPKNGNILIKELSSGVIKNNESDAYEVVAVPYDEIEHVPGDIIVVESSFVTRAFVKGEETLFVKRDNILAAIKAGPDSQPNPAGAGLIRSDMSDIGSM